MGETLTEQRRVNDEGLRVVKFCCKGYVGGERYPESLGVKREQAVIQVWR